jgi:hypothetical protein
MTRTRSEDELAVVWALTYGYAGISGVESEVSGSEYSVEESAQA